MPNKINMRIPTTEEWDSMMDITHTDDSITHWKDMLSWVHDEALEKQNPLYRTTHGYNSARIWYGRNATYRHAIIGFRPAVEGLAPDALTPNERGTTIIGTLFMDGKPVKVPQNPIWDGDIVDYVPSATLTIGPALNDLAYQVKGIILDNGIVVADRVLLKNISYEDIEQALYDAHDPAPALKKLWMRTGVSLFLTDEEIERLLTADDEDLTDAIVEGALKDGRWQFDGNSYIPQQVVEEFVRKHDLPYDTDQEPECELDPRHFCPAKTTR